MITKTSIPLLSKTVEARFNERQEISEDISHLEQRIADLKLERNRLDALLQKSLKVDTPYRLRGGIAVTLTYVTVEPTICTPEMVGTVIRKGYSFPKYRLASV